MNKNELETIVIFELVADLIRQNYRRINILRSQLEEALQFIQGFSLDIKSPNNQEKEENKVKGI